MRKRADRAGGNPPSRSEHRAGPARTAPADVPHLYRATAADAEAILLVRYPA
ncbi:hypothetical protein STTU_3141 [Streptomyces sp. Tu6071]|nr:hypothetical protein STTU_3141 [Streptomyces sp. Tu6071]